MKDRKALNLLRGAMTPLVAILLLGAFWLGVRPVPRHNASLQPASAVESATSAPSAPAPTFEKADLRATPAANHAHWLPRLSDQIQRVLYTMPVTQDPEAIGAPSSEAPGDSAPAVVADGPLLAPPTTPPPVGKPQPEQTAKPPVETAQPPIATSAWPRPPESGRSQPTPRPLPTVTIEVVEPPRAAGPDEPQPLPPAAQAEAEPRPLAGDSANDATPAPPPTKLSSPLAAARVPANRSEQLELLAREADTHSRYAFQLAGRGAVYAARAELIAAIRLVAQGLDGEQRTTAHSAAMAAGLTALKEAEDFAPGSSQPEGNLNLATIIAGHRTPVLRDVPTDGLTALNAMQQYLTFAQEQLAAACDREVAGSMALYGLGKLHAVLGNRQTEAIRAAAPKAVALYQASLLVYPRNHMASNDLGVLLAQAGRYNEARLALEHSANICRQEENWQNLAKVYRQLNQGAWAHYAEQQVAAIRQETARRNQGSTAGSALVQWVSPNVLAQPGSAVPGNPQPSTPNVAEKTQNAPGAAQPKAMSARLPDALFENRK